MPTKKINQTTDKNKVNTAETTGTAPAVESVPFPPLLPANATVMMMGTFPPILIFKTTCGVFTA